MNTKEELQKTLTDIDRDIGDAEDEKSELIIQIEGLEGDYKIINKIAKHWEGDYADLKKGKLDAEVFGESMRIERDGLARKCKALRELAADLYCGDEYHDEAGRVACRFCTSADKILAALEGK